MIITPVPQRLLSHEPKKTERLYLAGPMTDKPFHNFPEFFKNESYLESLGFVVLNPAQHDLDLYPDIETWPGHDVGRFHGYAGKGFDFAKIGSWDAEQIMDPNTSGIALLRGWEDSRGASAEQALAHWFHKKIYYVDADMGYFSDQPHPYPHPLVGLTGNKQAGKDTAAQALVKVGWKRVALADEVRAMALDIDPLIPSAFANVSPIRLSALLQVHTWDFLKEKYPEVRRLLQNIGTEAVRDRFGGNTWIDLAERLHFDEGTTPIVVTDVRFQNEADWIKRHGGEIVRIIRPGQAEDDQHRSETELAGIKADFELVNDGTVEHLHHKVLANVGLHHARAGISG